jgi:hypothetical protein
MDEATIRMMELSYRGYFCSQILLIMGLEAQGKTDPDLVRSMGGLANGCSFEGGPCGALTGAACLIGLYAGRGADDEEQDWDFPNMLQDLGDWFDRTYGGKYGGITCQAIVGDGTEKLERCGAIVAETYAKVVELLTASGYDLTVGK